MLVKSHLNVWSYHWSHQVHILSPLDLWTFLSTRYTPKNKSSSDKSFLTLPMPSIKSGFYPWQILIRLGIPKTLRLGFKSMRIKTIFRSEIPVSVWLNRSSFKILVPLPSQAPPTSLKHSRQATSTLSDSSVSVFTQHSWPALKSSSFPNPTATTHNGSGHHKPPLRIKSSPTLKATL